MKTWTTAAAFAFAVALTGASANAEPIVTLPGNDCSGEFGTGFDNCKIPAQYDPEQTPIVAKFDFSNSGAVTSIELNNTLYPSLDGSEWTFDFTGGTGTWKYTPSTGDPALTFFVAKGGPSFNLYSIEDDELETEFSTPINPNNGRPYGLSHLSFYDSESDDPGDPSPEPTTMALLGLGLFGAGFMRRRRR